VRDQRLEVAEERGEPAVQKRAHATSRTGDAFMHLRQLAVESCIEAAQLEQLRVRELEDVLHFGIARNRIDDESAVPRNNGEIVGKIGKAVREQVGERLRGDLSRFLQTASAAPRGSEPASAAVVSSVDCPLERLPSRAATSCMVVRSDPPPVKGTRSSASVSSSRISCPRSHSR